MAKKSLYLIHPRSVHLNWFGGDAYRGVGIADSALPVVAELAREHFDVTICDESIEPVDLNRDCDFVGITGKHGQGPRMLELAGAFRARGIPVILGGPYVSLAPGEVRGQCDVLALGEIEEIGRAMFQDLASGVYQKEYLGSPIDMTKAPVPRWELYDNARVPIASVQTSRGCPFECEFCDVIQYVGRKQRHKTIPQVLRELDLLYSLGYRTVFLADDNLTVFKRRAKELLLALSEWTAQKEEPVRFTTQISIEATDDEEMLDLIACSGLDVVFIGIETPNQEALLAMKKRQNLGVPMVERVERLARRGVMVISGAMVGFDHDNLDIFDRQFEFAQTTPIPIFTVSALFAADGTPLRERMEREGRLIDERAGMCQLSTNLIPAQMTSSQLQAGVRDLVGRLYEPDAFLQRLTRFISLHPGGEPSRARALRPVEQETLVLLQRARRTNPALKRVWDAGWELGKGRPAARPTLMGVLIMYAQALYILEHARNQPPARDGLPSARDSAKASGRNLPVLQIN